MEKFCVNYEQSLESLSSKTDNKLVLGIFPNDVYRKDSTSFTICHVSTFIFEILGKKLNLSLSFEVAHQNIPGYRLKNGSWNGVTGLIARELVDIIPAPFTHTEERGEVIDFTYLLPGEKVTAILSSPHIVRDNNIFAFMKGFSTQVWILLIISYFLIYALNIFGINEWRFKIFIALEYLAILLGKGLTLRNYHYRYLIMIWIFSSFILLNHFVSNISSALVTEKVETINSLQELIMRTDITIMVAENSSPHRLLREELRVVPSRLKAIKTEDFYSEETIALLLDNKHVYFSSESVLSRLLNYYFQYKLTITGQEGHTFVYGLPIRKSLNSTMKRKLTKILKSLYQTGIFGFKFDSLINFYKCINGLKIQTRISRTEISFSNNSENAEQRLILNINSLLLAFIILIFGSTFSSIILCTENFINYSKSSKRLSQVERSFELNRIVLVSSMCAPNMSDQNSKCPGKS